MSAPQREASSRRAAEKSLATIVCTPRALSRQMTARPIGPQPITIATSRLPISLRRTACHPIGAHSRIRQQAAVSPDRLLSAASDEKGALRRVAIALLLSREAV